MGTLTPLHVYVHLLEDLIDTEIERLMENMALGRHDYPEYKYAAGKIAGLAQTKEYLAEADRVYREKVL